MPKPNFLTKLKEEQVLELVDGSEEIKESYLIKSANSLKSARILKDNKLYEDSTATAYYSMYNALTALLFKVGIKCPNHAGSILLLKKVFNRNDLFKMISSAKDERIEKQYEIPDELMMNQATKELITTVEDFTTEIKLMIKKLKPTDITTLRNKIKKL